MIKSSALYINKHGCFPGTSFYLVGGQVAKKHIYQDSRDNDSFVFHPCRFICKDVRFGHCHFVDLIPVSDLHRPETSVKTVLWQQLEMYDYS